MLLLDAAAAARSNPCWDAEREWERECTGEGSTDDGPAERDGEYM